MKVVSVILTGLIFLPIVDAAEDIRPWQQSWDIDVWGGSCKLSREFSNAKALEATKMLGWEMQIFDRFSVSFSIPNDTRNYGGRTFVANELFFAIRADRYPEVSSAQLRIDSVRIEDVVLSKHLFSETASFRSFLALGADAASIFSQLEQVEPVSIVFTLSNGTSETIAIPSSNDDRFAIWAKLLRTCAAENKNS